jgi:hypothetical protein
MRYLVAVPTFALNGSYGMPTLFGFEANSEEEAKRYYETEQKKRNTMHHHSSRLFSGGTFWHTAKLYDSQYREILKHDHSRPTRGPRGGRLHPAE